jgi:hypothetical protein
VLKETYVAIFERVIEISRKRAPMEEVRHLLMAPSSRGCFNAQRQTVAGVREIVRLVQNAASHRWRVAFKAQRATKLRDACDDAAPPDARSMGE